MILLNEIKESVILLAKKINAPITEILTFGICRDDGTPCVQISQDSYYYIARDRNTITFQKRTNNLDELLYWIFCGITSEMAYTYAINNLDGNSYSRKGKFSKQIELLEEIDKKWSEKRKKEIQELISKYPDKDN